MSCVRRVGMVSLHTSPLETPGVGDAGGLNVYVAEVARRLAARGVEVDVFTRRVHADLPDTVDVAPGARVVHVTAGPVAPLSKEDLPVLVPVFRARLGEVADRYDVLHAHYWLSGAAATGLGRPLVQTMHTMAKVKNAAKDAAHSPEPDEREEGEAALVRVADVLTANTVDEAAELESHYGADPRRVHVVPPGVDPLAFHRCDRAESRARLDLPTGARIVLFVGRIQPLKAPDVLIRAVAALRDRDPAVWADVRPVVIGGPSGPDAGYSASLPLLAADLGLDVDFRPHSARAELFRWYCAADVVAVPSYNESFGLVALEAQACGRPVVATDVGGLRHAVVRDRTGLLVDGHDPQRWADALARVLGDPAYAERTGRAAAAHAERFSWDATASGLLDAYATACG